MLIVSCLAFLFIQHQIGIKGAVGTLGNKAGNKLALAICQHAVQLLNVYLFTKDGARHGEPALIAALAELRYAPLFIIFKELQLALALYRYLA